MPYLNCSNLEAVSADAFQAQKPYPWAYMSGTLTEVGWNTLSEALPDIRDFRLMIGVKRSYGQAPHNLASCITGRECLAQSLGKSLFPNFRGMRITPSCAAPLA